jgi:hypothetical protein
MILAFLWAMVGKELGTDYITCHDCGHGQAVECKQLRQIKPICFDIQCHAYRGYLVSGIVSMHDIVWPAPKRLYLTIFFFLLDGELWLLSIVMVNVSHRILIRGWDVIVWGIKPLTNLIPRTYSQLVHSPVGKGLASQSSLCIHQVGRGLRSQHDLCLSAV